MKEMSCFFRQFQIISYLFLLFHRQYALLQECPFPDETLIKAPRQPSVYVVRNCTKQEFPSGEVFLKFGFQFENVKTISQAELNSLPETVLTEPTSDPVVLPKDLNEAMLFIQQRLNRTQPSCKNYGHENVAHDLLHSFYAKEIGDWPILVHPRCLHMAYFGNHLGALLNQMACAKETGAHYLAIPYHAEFLFKQKSSDDERQRLYYARQNAFLRSFPEIYINPEAAPLDVVKQRVSAVCSCSKYCWEDRNAPWTHQIPFIRDILRNVSRAFAEYPPNIRETCTFFDKDRDRIFIPGVADNDSMPENLPCLPAIPDVAIQYRCSDNLGYNYGAKGYGLLPFRAIIQRIRSDDRYIYIVAEPGERTVPNPYCNNILFELQQTIHQHFPSATVLLKRGDDQLMDYIRLIYANRTICSPSTFCFYASLASQEAHFPLTKLIANTDPARTTKDNALDFGPNFHWIFDTPAIFHFREANEELLKLLKQDT